MSSAPTSSPPAVWDRVVCGIDGTTSGLGVEVRLPLDVSASWLRVAGPRARIWIETTGP